MLFRRNYILENCINNYNPDNENEGTLAPEIDSEAINQEHAKDTDESIEEISEHEAEEMEQETEEESEEHESEEIEERLIEKTEYDN